MYEEEWAIFIVGVGATSNWTVEAIKVHDEDEVMWGCLLAVLTP